MSPCAASASHRNPAAGVVVPIAVGMGYIAVAKAFKDVGSISGSKECTQSRHVWLLGQSQESPSLARGTSRSSRTDHASNVGISGVQAGQSAQADGWCVYSSWL